jgi:peroxiredoxin
MNNSKFKIQNFSFLFRQLKLTAILSAFCILLSASLFAQKTTISGKIENNRFTQADLQLLYKDDVRSFGNAKINADGTFKLNANLPKTDLYRLVFEEGQQMMMCLSPNQNIELTLDANNLSTIKSVKGSPSIEFFKTVTEMLARASTQMLFDSINGVLQANKDVQFYNEFQSQFKPFLDANTETDAVCLLITQATDSLQQYVTSKLIKGKVDPKDIDAFIYTSSNYMKIIAAQYKKYANYVNSMNSLYDLKNNRNSKFENFYSAGVDNYLDFFEQRNRLMEKTFSELAAQIEAYLYFRDSLQINDLASKKKEKELLADKIISISGGYSNVKDVNNSLVSYAKTADGYGRYALQEAQRNVSSIVQKYQKFFDTETENRNNAVVNYLLANKNDLAVLMFLDIFPRDKHATLHQEVAKALYAKYPEHPIVAERYRVETSPATSTSIGAMAPELAFENPDGKIMKLSDLKGKVVLLDFWAAWCRPCRQENPNVVAAYNKYRDKGFEVFSVSLDRDKASWVKAIKDDGLIWPNHVSDLGYWQSQGAKVYGVNSIPATFLIGKDGRIIAKNLRGAALENALKELLD